MYLFIYLLCLPPLDYKLFKGRNVMLFTIDPQCLEQGEDIVNVKEVFTGLMNKSHSLA